MVARWSPRSMSKFRAIKKIDAVFRSKVIEERRAVQDQLARLSRLATSGLRLKGIRGGARGPVAPKYRNPDNPAETWAGRGLRPRWLTAAMKGGKTLDDFAIGPG